MLYILLFGSRARGESHPDSGWDLFCHHLSRSVARREERDHQKMSIPFAQMGFHADVILQSQEKVKAPKEKTGVPCLSCAQRGGPYEQGRRGPLDTESANWPQNCKSFKGKRPIAPRISHFSPSAAPIWTLSFGTSPSGRPFLEDLCH